MSHTMRNAFLGILSLWGIISACDPAREGPPAYELAQGCYAIQKPLTEQRLGALDRKGYGLLAEEKRDGSAAFFLKPSGLGRFLLSDAEGALLASDHRSLKRIWQPEPQAEWIIRKLEVDYAGETIHGAYTMINAGTESRLIVRDGNFRVQSKITDTMKPEEVALEFLALDPSACRPFPEASLNAEISPEFHQPRSSVPGVYGFVDYHTHLAFPKALGAAAMSGQVFHPLGISAALNECSTLHGKNGEWDLLEGQTSTKNVSGHDVRGYPDFPYWPNRSTNTHIQAYYRWIERAYLAGLRLMVTNTTGNPTFCQLLHVLHPKEAQGDCRSDAEIGQQIHYIHELQDYIDAQEGGPGRGWFRIAKSSREAREIIADNRLAVVLGSEYGTLFDCTESSAQCNEAYVDQKLDELYNLGVRSLFPIHRFDNAFGGTRPQGGSNGAWMHLTSKLSTSHVEHLGDLLNPSKLLFKPIGGHYWELEQCPEGVSGTQGIRSMKEFIEKDFSFLTETVEKVPVVGGLAAKLLGWVFIDKLKPLPEYPEFTGNAAACNERPLQNIGRYLIQRLAEKGMILEIDHMSYPTLMDTLDQLEQLNYPGFVSSHGWIENQTDIRQRMFRLGGLMAASTGRPRDVAQTIMQYTQERESWFAQSGVGIGSDIQGVSTQAMGEDDLNITYPFASIDGKVSFLPPETGSRRFHYDQEGVAHYGLLAEWIEELRQVDEQVGSRAVESLMQSAEAYLQMWEAAERRADSL
jgi:microsomal dipeptidase-like Zn-dependent dipeptidase